MKKILLLVLAVTLALAGLSSALAEEGKEPDPALFEILEDDGGNVTRIASAVPVAIGVVVAPATLLPADHDRLAVSDGETSWPVQAVIPDGTGSVAMIFYSPQENPARYGFWPFMPWGSDAAAESCHVLREDGVEPGVTASEEIFRQGKCWFLFTLTEPAPAGSPVLTADGQLAGIVTAEWAEGVNRVLVMPTIELVAELSRAAALLGNLPDWREAPKGLNVTVVKNLVTIDWKEMALPEKKEGETLYLLLVDTGNSYLNYFPAETETRSLTIPLVPGRFYLAGVAASAATPDAMPEDYAVFSIPQAEKLTEYNFHPVVTAIAEAPEGGLKEDENPVPVTEVTEELLRSGRAYFYSHSTYEVAETVSGKSLLVTIIDPNGVCYRYESSWIYMPEYAAEDIWFLNLKDTGFTTAMDHNGYPLGVYQVAYYVDGDLADSFTFELN